MDKVIIYDFGSQYTQLIARRVRELNIYCEILPFFHDGGLGEDVKAVILSGSPFSVRDENRLNFNLSTVVGKVPVLGVCYGAQYVADTQGGAVEKSDKREYGRAHVEVLKDSQLFKDVNTGSQVWMSHGDSITAIPSSYEIVAKTESIPVATYQSASDHVYCLQFHPEVTHSVDGLTILKNFLVDIAGCSQSWTPATFVEEAVQSIRKEVGDEHVLLALSGGVDSSVVGLIMHETIGDRLHCFFVDNGLLREDEYQEVLDSYKSLGLNITGIDARERFYERLKGVTDPEKKRKAIGNLFVEIFEEQSKSDKRLKWLAQGTIYPDVIESISVHGPSATIKSHHNVGGLPEKFDLKIIEPLRFCFKDEVRKIGAEVQVPQDILKRHPFPGPGLAIRILGEVNAERVAILQKADGIYLRALRASGWYDKIWQAGAILLPVKSVGVMGDERTYENTLALRAVTSLDGMTADWVHLPYDLLAQISNEIINQVKGINRVVYDISSKPPATIEWE